MNTMSIQSYSVNRPAAALRILISGAACILLAACGGAPAAQAPSTTATNLPTAPALEATVAAPTVPAPAVTESPVAAATVALHPQAPAAVAPASFTGLYVDPAQELGPISPAVYGTNFGPWTGLSPTGLGLAKEAGITVIRWPGGEWGDANTIQTSQLDFFVSISQMMGSEPYIHVNLRTGTPEAAAALVRYANLEKGYGVRYWAIGNEPSLFQGHDEKWTTDYYNAQWRIFAEAMRAVDPGILLLGPEVHQFTPNLAANPKDSQGKDWTDEFLKANGDLVDIVTVHRYPFPVSSDSGSAPKELMRANPAEWPLIVEALRGQVRTLTGREIPVAIAEVNSHWSRAAGGATTPDSLFNAIWWADVLGKLISSRVEMVNYFMLSTSGSGDGFGMVTSYAARPAYYTQLLYSQFGETLLAAFSDDPLVSVYAARRTDGALTLMLVNIGPEAAEKPLAIAGLAAGATAELLRLDAEHSAAPVEAPAVSAEMTILLPAESVSLLTIR